jgi:hypothetical protein
LKKIKTFLKQYNLEIDYIDKVDLAKCFFQYIPERPLDELFNGNRLMTNSPHCEIFDLYFNKGKKWLKKNYKTTKYHELMKLLQKPAGFPTKIIQLGESMKKGYLVGDHKKDYIVVMNIPFAKSRYNRNIEMLAPEIWSGHHRAGALLALGYNSVDVIYAKDSMPGSKQCYGKIHDFCVEN